MGDVKDSGGRPAREAGGAIISEMVEAGFEEYCGHWLGLRDADEDVTRQMVRDVYAVMSALAQRE